MIPVVINLDAYLIDDHKSGANAPPTVLLLLWLLVLTAAPKLDGLRLHFA